MTAFELEHKKELIETARLYRIFSENEDLERAEKAELFAAKILKNNYMIGFAGHFSSGKSSMINALTGETLLPSSPIPTSANIVNVQKAKTDYAIVNMKDRQPVFFPENYDFDAVKSFCKNGEVTQIEIGHSGSVLPDGVTVMDTPGVDSTDDAHRMSTESALHVADMVFYVMDYNHVQSELNFNFTKELQKYTDLYLIVNQIDKHQESEMSFPDFKASVRDSFSRWGVEPKNIFFTSLKVHEHPYNDFEKVKNLVSASMKGWKGYFEQSANSSLNQLKDEHLSFLEEEKMERLNAFSGVLSEEEWQNRQELKKENATLSKTITVSSFESWKTDFEKNRKDLLENANIMPFELRDSLKNYLESEQPNFKVGVLFSGKKTQEERNARKEEVARRLNETASAQIENHLKKLMKSSLKDARILSDEESMNVDEMKFQIPFSVVESQVPKGAVLSGDAVLNFANNVSTAVQKWFIAETENWKRAQEAKFEGMTDDTVNEMGMKAQLLDQKMLAIRTLEEMDVRIKKVEQSFLAMMPTQKKMAEEQLHKWQEKFQQSREDMIDFTPDMLEQETATTETERSPAEANETHSFDEEVVLKRVNRTFEAIKSIRGFTETAQYIKRKASRLENQEFTIALFGAFSAGKSSFSNALMGESVLPVSPNPTTATINRIRPVAADKPHETADVRMKTVEQMAEDLRSSFRVMGMEISSLEDAYRKSASLAEEVEIEQQVHKSFINAFREGYPKFKDSLGQVIRTNRDEFSLFVAKEERSCFVDEIDFYFDCSLTRSGVTLVDTPGADSINARHTNVAFEYIRNADAVLFITYYNHAFARADREFLIQLGRVKDTFEMDKMFFIVNAIDLAHDQEEQRAVEDYVQGELQRFGIRFPRLYGVSSLLALQDPENSGMPKFEEDFQHFLKDELKGMAVQSLAEEEQKAVDRFRGLIEQTEQNLLRKDERLEELKRIEQQTRILFENSAARILSKEASQEVEELLYYVHQRVFYRFNDFFKEAFNPSVFANKSAQKALDAALEDIKQMTGFDFEQEMRVTNLRLARFIEKKVENRFKEDTAKLKEMNPEFSFAPYEMEEAEPLVMEAPFGSKDYSAVKSHYKNNRSFFEKNEKEKLRDALKSLMEPDAKQYLDHEKQRLKEWADFWIEQEAEGLRLYLTRQTTEQVDSERTLLLEQERLDEWKELLARLSEERV